MKVDNSITVFVRNRNITLRLGMVLKGTDSQYYEIASISRELKLVGLINKTNHMNGNTIGEQRVRVDFNVSNSSTVDSIKSKTADLINDLECLRSFDVSDWPDVNEETIKRKTGEKLRLISLAQTTYEEAAMWAVKAATA